MSWDREQKRLYAKEYYKKNREEVLRKKRERETDPEVSKKIKEYLSLPDVLEHRRNYTKNKRKEIVYKEEEKKQSSGRRAERRRIINLIQIHYGCKNPECSWIGDYYPEILDFHHFNPAIKSGQVSLMISHKSKKIAEEINKCVILCRNCHALFHIGKVELNEDMLCCVNEVLEIIK